MQKESLLLSNKYVSQGQIKAVLSIFVVILILVDEMKERAKFTEKNCFSVWSPKNENKDLFVMNLFPWVFFRRLQW